MDEIIATAGVVISEITSLLRVPSVNVKNHNFTVTTATAPVENKREGKKSKDLS